MQPSQSPEEQLKLQKLLNNADDISCKCGCTIFSQGIRVKKISALDPLNTSGQEQMANLPVMYCIKCHEEIDIFK